MASENPYQSPRSRDAEGARDAVPSIGFRCLRALVLGFAGFVAYTAALAFSAELDVHELLDDSRTVIGLLVAAALSGSEIAWSLDQSTLRRVMISAVLMFPACVIGSRMADVIDPPGPLPGNYNFPLSTALGVVAHLMALLLTRVVASVFASDR